MSDPDEAVRMVNRLIRAECRIVAQLNARGRISKEAWSNERKAARDLFIALVGYPPSPEQQTEMEGE